MKRGRPHVADDWRELPNEWWSNLKLLCQDKWGEVGKPFPIGEIFNKTGISRGTYTTARKKKPPALSKKMLDDLMQRLGITPIETLLIRLSGETYTPTASNPTSETDIADEDGLLRDVTPQTPSEHLEILEKISRQTLIDCGRLVDGFETIELDTLYCTRDCETTITKKLLEDEEPIFISGIAGSGKTSILWRIAQRLRESGNQILFLRADFVVSPEGAILLRELPAVQNANAPSFILVDTADSVSNAQVSRNHLTLQIELAIFKGYRIALTCRPAETKKFFSDYANIKIPEEYSLPEFCRIVDSHVRAFYGLKDATAVSTRVDEILNIVSGVSPISKIARNPLMLRMLFVLYAPLRIPKEINSIALFLEYWNRRVCTDSRAGQNNEIAGARDLSDCASKIAIRMMTFGTLQLSGAELASLYSTRKLVEVEVHDLISRGILRRVSMQTQFDGIEFFHQNFFEFAGAWAIANAQAVEPLENLFTHIMSNPFDFLRLPILQSTLALSFFGDTRMRLAAERIIEKVLLERLEHLTVLALFAVAQVANPSPSIAAALRTACDDRSNASRFVRLTSSSPLSGLAALWDLFSELWLSEELAATERDLRSVRTAILEQLPSFVERDKSLSKSILEFLNFNSIVAKTKDDDLLRLTTLLLSLAKTFPDECCEVLHGICETIARREQKQFNALAQVSYALCQVNAVTNETLQRLRSLIKDVDDRGVRRVMAEIDSLVWNISDGAPYDPKFRERYSSLEFVAMLRCWLREKSRSEFSLAWDSFIAYVVEASDARQVVALWSRECWDRLGQNPFEPESWVAHPAFEFLVDTIPKSLLSENLAERSATELVCSYLRSAPLLRELYLRLDMSLGFANFGNTLEAVFFPDFVLATGNIKAKGEHVRFVNKSATARLFERSEDIIRVHPQLTDALVSLLIVEKKLNMLEVQIREGDIHVGSLDIDIMEALAEQIATGCASDDMETRHRAARLAFIAAEILSEIPMHVEALFAALKIESNPRVKSWLAMTSLSLATSDDQIRTGYSEVLKAISSGDEYVRDKAFGAFMRWICRSRTKVDVNDIYEALGDVPTLSKICDAMRSLPQIHEFDGDLALKLADYLLFGEVVNGLGKPILRTFQIKSRVPLQHWLTKQTELVVEKILERIGGTTPDIGLLIAKAAMVPPHLNRTRGILERLAYGGSLDTVLAVGIGNIVRKTSEKIEVLELGFIVDH